MILFLRRAPESGRAEQYVYTLTHRRPHVCGVLGAIAVFNRCRRPRLQYIQGMIVDTVDGVQESLHPVHIIYSNSDFRLNIFRQPIDKPRLEG